MKTIIDEVTNVEDFEEYVQKTGRTDLDYHAMVQRIKAMPDKELARLLALKHYADGLASEAGEVQDAIKKHFYYGQDLDMDYLTKEVGDCGWYFARLLSWFGKDWMSILRFNLIKLARRYPTKFTTKDSIERKDEND